MTELIKVNKQIKKTIKISKKFPEMKWTNNEKAAKRCVILKKIHQPMKYSTAKKGVARSKTD
jgi:hypothetical protein